MVYEFKENVIYRVEMFGHLAVKEQNNKHFAQEHCFGCASVQLDCYDMVQSTMSCEHVKKKISSEYVL